jgi:phosphoribosylamine--glycine ligase
MKILLVGGGGREDALAWAIRRSPLTELLRCAPGNAGTEHHGENVAISATDIDGLLAHAREQRYDLVVIGPEAPLVAGLGDRLRAAGLAVFGPSAAASRIEGSKAFAKLFMERHRIPTAAFQVFDDYATTAAYLESDAARFPTVVKADGLAAGKGVVLAQDREQALSAAKEMLVDGRFGDAGRRIVVEELLTGREASFFVLSDGDRTVQLATCQDYKRALDDDEGPNTGGMGTYSPSVYLDDAMREQIVAEIVRPTIDGLAREDCPYRGVLYVGLMLTDDGPQVLEYNARFGDPETQVLIPRLDGDWLPLLHGCAVGSLDPSAVRWTERASVCVVLAAGGYPAAYEKGAVIEGIEQAESDPDVVVFHAGTARDANGRFLTAGGRVLGVTGLGDDLAAARETAYAAVSRIRWTDLQHRSDIAADAILRLREGDRT